MNFSSQPYYLYYNIDQQECAIIRLMKKFNTCPLSGMQELTPALQAEFDQARQGVETTFRRHGFLHIETPTIERSEILLAKAGGETEKQIYKVVKTAEAENEADQALRFDHTVPLARYTVEHLNDLAFPFKVTQVGRNFRGERPQKGRFREFYQCDVDVVGRNVLPLEYDAEVIITLAEALLTLPLPGKFRVRVSNRKLLSGLLEALNLKQHAEEIFGIIDHAEKVPREKTVQALEELQIGSENVVKITTFMEIGGAAAEIEEKLNALGVENANFRAGVEEIKQVLYFLQHFKEAVGVDFELVADMKIVRGLDYYTGTVFETVLFEHPEVGSICSGGRYENLASNYTDQQLPGVGGSIGLTRLFYVLQNFGTVAEQELKPVDYVVILVGENGEVLRAGLKLEQKLREHGYVAEIVWGDKKMGDKIKYAAKIARKLIVLGEDEVGKDYYQVKDLETGSVGGLMLK